MSRRGAVAVFKNDQDNLAQPDTGYVIPGTIFEASPAAQGTTSEGFELELVGRPVPGWELSFSYTDFTAEDAEGVDVNMAQPRQLAKLFTTYNFVQGLPALTLGGGISWEASNYTTAVNPFTGDPERLEQDAYSLVNLMARYEFGPRLSAQVNVENLFDETFYSQIGFYSQLAYGEPRTYNVGFQYRL